MATEQVIVKISADISKLQRQMKKAESRVNQSVSSMRSAIKGLITITGTYLATKKFIAYGDAWSNINSQLRLVTNSTKELNDTQKKLFEISQDTRNSLDGTVTLYSKMKRATQELSVSDEKLFKITETINKAITVSGATMQEANSALLQLGQGMASGVLRGEELNSVMENTPALAQAIADGMGVQLGALRALGSEGKITAETIVTALDKVGSNVDTKFSKVTQTVGQSTTTLGNSMLQMVGKVDKAFGITSGLAKTISSVSKYIDKSIYSILSFGAYASAVIQRTKILFNAIGLTIKTGFIASFGAVSIAFGEMELSIVSGIYQMAIAINNLRSKLGKKAFDLEGLKGSFQSVAYGLDTLKDKIVQTGKEAGKAWKDFGGFDIKAEAVANLLSYKDNIRGTEENIKKAQKSFKKFGQVGAEEAKKVAKELKAINNVIGSSLTNSFRQSLDGALNWGDAMKSMLKDVIAKMFEMYVIQKLLGLGGTTIGTTSNPVIAKVQAKGGVWNGGSYDKAFAKGGVVDSPTTFGMSKGQTGLMGEAGVEAIMPLGRMSNGDLGIQGTALNVNIINNAGVEVTTSQEGEDFNVTLERIDSALADGVRRRTSSLSDAIQGIR